MPRRRRLRKIVAPPNFKGYKPYGINTHERDAIELLYEEYEAIKLADFDFMNHAEAAELMGVSRPTFARIYESARRKVAKALVETREIKTVFGNVELDKSWHLCNDCNARFTIPKTMKECKCPLCGSLSIEYINDNGEE